DASELPLELVAPEPPRRAATTALETHTHPLEDLQQHRRAALAPQLWARRIIFALAGIAVSVGVLIWWTREPASQRAVVQRPRAIITLANLPDDAFVWLDGIRTFLNPVELPLGGDRHELRIECDGYRSRTIGIVPSADQTIDAHLERASPPG